MPTSESTPALKWEVRQRLTLLEATVFWSGELVTTFLTDSFNISRIQATKDIKLYLSLRPDNLRYDRSLKRYLITEHFVPLFISGNPQECLQVLQASRNNASPLVTLVNNLPAVEVVASASRLIDIEILKAVLQAARFGWILAMNYQSMSRPEPATHIVQPQTLVFDGQRWHMRAYSHGHGEFRDFVLARILRVTIQGKTAPALPADHLWKTILTAEVGPHPGLSEHQQRVVERDYGMIDGRLSCQVRAALLPYWLLAMRIGPDDLHREALVQQIVLLNRKALQAYTGFR